MGYFYHGVADMVDEEILEHIINILKSGELKTREDVFETHSPNKDMNHICLYRKNPEFDYSDEEEMLNTARAGWIDHCFVFIISPDIDAEKTPSTLTNLQDEWRSNGPISFDKVVALAIPYEGIAEYKQMTFNHNQKEFLERLNQILAFAKNMNWRIVNSDEPDFCDKLDQELAESKPLL